ncbi:MAG: hypothetical protein U1D55_00095 [Phycisphaerae bacterium]
MKSRAPVPNEHAFTRETGHSNRLGTGGTGFSSVYTREAAVSQTMFEEWRALRTARNRETPVPPVPAASVRTTATVASLPSIRALSAPIVVLSRRDLMWISPRVAAAKANLPAATCFSVPDHVSVADVSAWLSERQIGHYLSNWLGNASLTVTAVGEP